MLFIGFAIGFYVFSFFVIQTGVIIQSINLELRDSLTISLTYFLVIATVYYAWTNSVTLNLMEEDRLFRIQPDFAFRMYKKVEKQTIYLVPQDKIKINILQGKKTYREKEVIDRFFLYLRNIGRGSAKSIRLEIFLIARVEKENKYFKGEIELNPMMSKEEIWIDISVPFKIDNITIERKGEILIENGNDIHYYIEANLLFYDVNENFYEKYYTHNIEIMEKINEKVFQNIRDISLENQCILTELSDEKQFNIYRDIFNEGLEFLKKGFKKKRFLTKPSKNK